MTLEDIQNLVNLANEVGYPVLVGLLALIILGMMAKSYFKTVDSNTDINESTHTELFELRKQVDKAIAERIALEKEHANCDKERQRLQDYITNMEQKQQDAVDEFLDDTHNYGKRLDEKDKEILRLTGQLADKDAVIAEQNQIIAKLVEGKTSEE